jgi:tryptophan synthase alpha chain
MGVTLMQRIAKKFAELKEKGRKALVAYLTAGYPDLDTTRDLVLALDGAGVDILELGIPFSDPTADGPAIQKASQEALRGGTTLSRVLHLLGDLRKSTEIPTILFSYYNPIFVFGNQRFAREAAAAGADGVLVVDLPLEEAAELKNFTDEAGLALIPLVAPTTGAERMGKIAREASGFIYYVSLTGVTGTGIPVLEELRENVGRIKSKTEIPVVAGFGISTPAQARDIAAAADGVVVGSAFIRLIAEKANGRGVVEAVGAMAKSLKDALV